MLSLRFEQARKAYCQVVESLYYAAVMRNGYSYTATDLAPETPWQVKLRIAWSRRTGRPYPVFKGGSDKTVFDWPYQNYMFRYLHDHDHYGGFTFKPEHERILGYAWTWKVLHLTRMRDVALIAELDTVGQTDYYAQHGAFPEDQRAFVRAKFMERAT